MAERSNQESNRRRRTAVKRAPLPAHRGEQASFAQPPHPLPIWMFWAGMAGIVLVYALLRVQALDVPLDRDEGVFGYIGQRIAEGGLPYRDGVDHKPPGVFYLYALALQLFPATPSGVHAFLHSYNFLTLIALIALMLARFRSRGAALAGGFCFALFSASPAIQSFTASTEMLILLPIVVCLLLAVAGVRRDRSALIFLSGVFGAAAFWIKPTAASSVAFAALYLVLPSWLDEQPAEHAPRRQALRLALWCAGAAALSAPLAGFFYMQGLFSEFVYWSFTHNIAYAGQVPVAQTLASLGRSIGDIVRGDFAVIGVGLAAAAWGLRFARPASLFVTGFLVCSIAGTLPGFAYRHYFAQLAPAVAVASGWGLALAASRFRIPPPAALAGALLLAIPPLVVHRDYFFTLKPEGISRRYFGLNPFPESAQIAAYLEERTSPSDRVFIFGSEPQILFLSGRRSATPFVMVYPLTREYARHQEFQERVWQDIVQSRPAYLLLVNIPTSTLWDGRAKLPLVERIDGLIREHYRLAAVMPVVEPEGKLIQLAEGQRPDPTSLQGHYNVYIYGRVAAK